MEKEDKIIKCLAYDGKVSVICSNTTTLTQEARKIHDLSPVATAALGRVLTIAVIMGSELKEKEDKLTIQIKGNGPIGQVIVVSNADSAVKGYVQNPYVDIPLKENGKLDVGAAIGKNGFLNVIKDIGLKQPYVGMVPLVSGEVAEDFTQYFASSEQTPTVVSLGVLVNKDGVVASGGYKIALMPGSGEEEIQKVEKAIQKIEPVSELLRKGLSLKEIAIKITGDKELQVLEDNILPTYQCDCSKEKMEKALISIGKKEIQDMIKEDEKAELVCHFCHKKYQFNKQELENIRDNI